MRGLFSINLDAIKEKNSIIAGQLDAADTSRVEVVESKSGMPVPCAILDDGRKLFVHSRIDPLREAERFISEVDFSGKDIVIMLGFGFGYHCELLADRIPSDINLVVIEKNPSIVKSAFESRAMERTLGLKNFFLFIEPSEESLAGIFRGKSSRNVIFVTHRGSSQLYPDYYAEMISLIKSFFSTKDVNIATLARFEKTWSSNAARNIGAISRSCGVNRFFGKFDGVPAIVAAAGPSLTHSIDFIKSNAGRAVIIAVDTSYKVLRANGITPHFCLSVDPQLINARYYEGIEETDTVLVSDPAVHPSLIRFFKGRMALTGIAFDMMRWIDDICGHKGELTHGGSVSTNAYDFAKRLGASPVLMVGQDLSFTSRLAHARGSYLDEQIHNRTYRFDNAQMFNRRQLASLPAVYQTGVRGESVMTNQKLMIFQNWFEKRNDPDLINATYNGVCINGIKNIPHDKLKFSYPESEISGVIDRLYSEFSSDEGNVKIKRLKKKIDEMLAEIEKLVPALEKASGYAADLAAMIGSGADKKDPGKVSFILKKLSETDRFVESMNKSKGLISFSIQRVIHTITEGYELAPGKSDNAAERSLFLYNGLLEGAMFNKKILGKMKSMLDYGE